MSPLVTEHLNGGIVTIRNPYELAPGEIQKGDECVYRLHDPAIWGRPGRTQYNTTLIKDASGTNAAVKGLAHMTFEAGRTDQILAYGGNDDNLGALWVGDFTTVNGSATFVQVTGPGQVTDAVTNATTTVTSASGGFANMVQGARIIGPGIPASALVTAVNSATNITISIAATASATITATFDIGIAVTPRDAGGEILDIVQWGGAYYQVGNGTSQRIYYKARGALVSGGGSATPLNDLLIARPVGLLPVTVAPTVSIVAGSWSAVLGNGVYWFLYTEVYNPGQADEVEGTYIQVDDKQAKLGPVAIAITDFTSQSVLITRNSQVNNGAPGVSGRLSTHWYVYMSPRQNDNVTTPSLATFTRVATIPMLKSDGTANLTATLQDSNLSRTGFSTVVAAVPGRNQFTAATNLTGPSDNFLASGASGGSPLANDKPMNKLQSFSFSGVDATYASSTVTGIKVTIRGEALYSSGYFLYLRATTGNKTAPPIWGTFNGMSLASNNHGDQFDLQGGNFTTPDFAVGGGFEVWLEKPGSNSKQVLFVDSVQVTVYYSGTSINNNGAPFRVITYRDSIGFTIDVPARYNPPDSTTIESFQGSIVANDIANQTTFRWSLPGEPESWPSTYTATLTTRKDDNITCIRAVNNILLVGTPNELHRVNYLPTEADTDFREGIAHETIAGDCGIVGPLAAVRFSRAAGHTYRGFIGGGVGSLGGGTHLAFVSYHNLMVTDGVTITYLNRDIRISDFIDPAHISQCVFRNYPKEQWLVLFYTPIGGTFNSKALIFSYDQLKDDGTLRAIGPITVNARSACEATLNGTPMLLTGHQFGGTIWTEDQGSNLTGYTVDGSTQVVAAPSIITRRLYPAGLDRNARTEKQYAQVDATGAQFSAPSSVMTKGSAVITNAGGWAGITRGMRIVHTNIPGDAIVLSVAGNNLTASQVAFETLTDTVLFDNGTISVTIRGQKIGTPVSEIKTSYASTFVGGLFKTAIDAYSGGFDAMIEKVRMSDNDTLVDLNTSFRLHNFTYDFNDSGMEQTRAGAQ